MDAGAKNQHDWYYYDHESCVTFYIPDNGSCFDSIYYDNKFYFSGAIEYVKNIWFPDQGKFQYGYFEILCKLPIHQGAFPAFWLQAANTNL